MSEELALMAVREERGLMPAITMESAVNRRNTIIEFTKRVMVEGKDYGVVPGTGDKPTLLKPGAEKLCNLFGLTDQFELMPDSITDFERGLFYYRYKCILRHGEYSWEGEGSANSMEKKYRYRNVVEWKATDEDKANALKVITKRDKYGKDYKTYVVVNSEPFELINTLQKMAQKRALVAATLIAVNASDFFTQDVEDMGFIEADFSDVEEAEPKKPAALKPSPAPENAPAAQRAPKEKASVVDPKIQALVDAGVAENIPNAARIMTMFGKPDATKEEAVAWGKLYRGWRDTGLDAKPAAENANKGLKP